MQSGLSPTLQKAECVNIPEMTLRSGMNHAIDCNEFCPRLPEITFFPTAIRGLFSPENQWKTMGIPGKRKKSEKSAFLGWTASEVPLINRAHHPKRVVANRLNGLVAKHRTLFENVRKFGRDSRVAVVVNVPSFVNTKSAR